MASSAPEGSSSSRICGRLTRPLAIAARCAFSEAAENGLDRGNGLVRAALTRQQARVYARLALALGRDLAEAAVALLPFLIGWLVGLTFYLVLLVMAAAQEGAARGRAGRLPWAG